MSFLFQKLWLWKFQKYKEICDPVKNKKTKKHRFIMPSYKKMVAMVTEMASKTR